MSSRCMACVSLRCTKSSHELSPFVLRVSKTHSSSQLYPFIQQDDIPKTTFLHENSMEF